MIPLYESNYVRKTGVRLDQYRLTDDAGLDMSLEPNPFDANGVDLVIQRAGVGKVVVPLTPTLVNWLNECMADVFRERRSDE